MVPVKRSRCRSSCWPKSFEGIRIAHTPSKTDCKDTPGFPTLGSRMVGEMGFWHLVEGDDDPLKFKVIVL